MSLNEIIPAAWRKPLYLAFVLVSVALGAIATAYGPENTPAWHAVTTNVVLYIGGAFGLTAAANTIVARSTYSDDAEEIESDDAEDIPLDEDGEYDDEELADAEVDLSPAADYYRPRH